MSWDDLSDVDVELLRRFQEPRLKPDQIAELDGKIVARGGAVAEEDVVDSAGDAESDADDADSTDDDADDADDAPDMSRDDPVRVTRHATRMLWDVYRKHAAASAELREQTNEMNRRTIEQARQLDEALSKSRQPAPPIRVDLAGVTELLRVGAGVVRDLMHGVPPREAESEPESESESE